MLDSASDLSDKILALAPSDSATDAMKALTDVIGDFMDKVQPGSLGSPGIFTLNRAPMAALLAALPPAKDDSWIDGFAAAWLVGVLTATITPGKAMSPAWIGSGTQDILTLPIGAASIPTASAAMSILKAGLADAKGDDNAAMPMAKAIRDATLGFTFLCIGLGPPPVFPPIPLPQPAK